MFLLLLTLDLIEMTKHATDDGISLYANQIPLSFILIVSERTSDEVEFFLAELDVKWP